MLAVGKSLWTEHWESGPAEKPTGIQLIGIDGSTKPIDDRRLSAMVLEFVPTNDHDSDRLLVIGGRDVETHRGLLRAVNVDDGTKIAEREFDFTGLFVVAVSRSASLWPLHANRSPVSTSDIATFRTQREFESPSPLYYSLSFSPDGKSLVAGRAYRHVHRFRTISGGPIEQWEVESGRHVRTLDQHTELVMNLAFSPDGATLVSGSVDGTVRLWILRPVS